jgi:hypothetical protein
VCKNCLQEVHETLGCENAKVMDLSHVPEKTIAEAWAMLKQASDEREIGEFKEASLVQFNNSAASLTLPLF